MRRRARRRGGAAALMLALAAAGCAEMQAGAPEAESGAASGAATEAEPEAEIAAAGPAPEPPTTGVLGRSADELLVEVEAGTGRLAIVPKPPPPGPEPVFAVDATAGETPKETAGEAAAADAQPRRPARDREAEREFAEARRELGLALERVGDIPGAVSELEAARAAAPGAWGARTEGTPLGDLARICRRGEPPEAVVRACTAAATSNLFAPATLADLLAHRGDANMALGREARALADYDAALEIESAHPGALIGRARLRVAAGRPQRALNDLRLAIETGPRPAEARLERARAYAALGLPERALADYDAVLTDPEARAWHPAAWRGRAEAHCAMGRADTAAVDWQAWADSVPGGPAYLQELLRARGYLRAPWEPGVGEATRAGLRGWTAAGCP